MSNIFWKKIFQNILEFFFFLEIAETKSRFSEDPQRVPTVSELYTQWTCNILWDIGRVSFWDPIIIHIDREGPFPPLTLSFAFPLFTHSRPGLGREGGERDDHVPNSLSLETFLSSLTSSNFTSLCSIGWASTSQWVLLHFLSIVAFSWHFFHLCPGSCYFSLSSLFHHFYL